MPPEAQYLGRYEIVEELGHGAMGTVYRARDPKIDRVVAIKTIKLQAANAEEEADYRKRFFREAQAAGKLAHPGIVTIYDVGEDEATRTPFIVMEFVPGQTLEKFAATPLPVDVVLDLIKQVAEALDYAHQQGIIHRDIKPANIMVGEDGRSRIADFGIAKLEHSEYTMPGQILGTPCFMSPEQLKGEPVTGRSDIFALGVILYTLLAGQKPFEGDSVPAITFQVAYKDPAPVTEKNPALGPYFNEVVARSLAKDPAQRYGRGKELARDIEDLRNGRVPRSISGVASESSKAMPALAGRPAEQSSALPALATSSADRTVRTGAGAAPAPAAVPADGATIVRGSTSTSVQVPTPPAIPATVVQTAASAPVAPAQSGSSGGKAVWLVIALAILLVGWFGWSRIQSPTSASSRDDSSSSEQESVGRSDLRFVCVHSFAAGQFTVWVDNDQVLIGKLTPRRREFIQSVHVPGGKHTVRVRVTSRNDAYDQTKDVKADFPPGGELTVYANTIGGDLSLGIR